MLSSPYTDPAIAEVKNALTHRISVLAGVNEIVMLLEDPDASLADWLGRSCWRPASSASRCLTPRCNRGRRSRRRGSPAE